MFVNDTQKRGGIGLQLVSTDGNAVILVQVNVCTANVHCTQNVTAFYTENLREEFH